MQQQSFMDGKNFQGKLQLSPNILRITLIVPSKHLILFYEINNSIIKENKGLFIYISNVDDLYSEFKPRRQLQVDDRNRVVISAQGIYGEKKINHSIVLEFKVLEFQSQAKVLEFMFKYLEDKLAFSKIKQNHSLAKKILFTGDCKNKFYSQYQIKENLYSLRQQGKQEILLNHKDEMPKNGVYEISFKLLQQDSSHVSIGLCAMNIFQSPNSLAPLTLKKLWVGLDLANCQVTHNEQKIKFGDIQFIKGSKCTMTVNMDLQQISWAIDDYQFVMVKFTDHLCHQRFYPFISMKKKCKTIEFLQQ